MGHPSLEKEMQIMKKANVDELPGKDRKRIADILKYYHESRRQQRKPRRFINFIKQPLIGECNHTWQINVVKQVNGNLLHVNDIGKKFHKRSFNDKTDSDNRWKTLIKCWVDMLPSAPDYVCTDAGTNIHSSALEERAENGNSAS